MKQVLPSVIVVFPVLMLVACLDSIGVRYIKVDQTRYPPPSNPVTIEAKTRSDMIQRGYVLLGYMDYKERVRTCYSGQKCLTLQRSGRLQQLILRKANANAASLATMVHVRSGKEPELKEICTAYTREYADDGSRLSIRECDDYRRIPGVTYYNWIRILLWRHDPVRARSPANQNAVSRVVQSR